MKQNTENKIPLTEKLKTLREKYLPYEEKTMRVLIISALVMYIWIIIWALVFKLGNETILKNLYINLKDMTVKERILWDLIPFNYRGTDEGKRQIITDTILNCFVFAPVGVLISYVFNKPNILRDASICFVISLVIEMFQLCTMLGNPATEDLITNLVGYFIGYGFYMLLFKRLSVKHTVITALVVNIVFAAAVIYSFVSTIGAAELIYGIVTKTL